MNHNTENNLAIIVENISKDFKLPHEKHSSIKSTFLNSFRRKEYEVQHALREVSFEIKKGEFFGIVGRNGSGKSTLLKCIAGVYHPNEGRIKINGRLVPFIELGVGFNPELSGRDNVYLNGALLGFSRKQIASMYDDIVSFAELEQFMDQKLKNYSSGMQVRLAFSIAIRARGDILLLDEVLAVGDTAFQRKCYRYFEDLKNSDTTVVLVTHDMGAVQRFCDRAVIIESGIVIKKGSAQEVTDEYRSVNITPNSMSGAPKISKRNETVKITILDQSNNKVRFKMQHQEKDEAPYYFGFSLIKDGMTFAELSSLDSPKAKIKNKALAYELDISELNPGTYEISATLFKVKAKEPIAFTNIRPQFIIKGFEANKGSALKLNESWIDL